MLEAAPPVALPNKVNGRVTSAAEATLKFTVNRTMVAESPLSPSTTRPPPLR